MHALQTIGARISIDDFGTGYSSLSYLRSFPFDKIKIGQSFIRDLDKGADSRAIVRAITGLGHSLGMRTTAEGVETAGNWPGYAKRAAARSRDSSSASPAGRGGGGAAAPLGDGGSGKGSRVGILTAAGCAAPGVRRRNRLLARFDLAGAN